MASETVQKTLTYKRANYLQGEGTLQKDLKSAIDKAKTVGSRKQIVNAAENTFLLLNSVRTKWSMLFGAMLIYSRGRNQPLVTENDSADELKVEQLAPPKTAAGERRDFVESLLFFGIKDNHVILLQSAGLRARQLETHLNWLLQTKTNVMDENDRVELADQPSKGAMREVLKSPVKKVSIGVPLESKPAGTSARTTTSTTNVAFRPTGRAFAVLSSLLGSGWQNKVRLDESLDESKLKVEVLVSYTRSTSDSGQDLLNDIARQLRHQEEEDVTIHLKSGAKISGTELKVSGQISAITYGGLLDPEDLFPRMKAWFDAQLESGTIDA
jgi:hypothetical protein